MTTYQTHTYGKHIPTTKEALELSQETGVPGKKPVNYPSYINLRLTPNMVRRIDRLVNSSAYNDRSKAIRSLIEGGLAIREAK